MLVVLFLKIIQIIFKNRMENEFNLIFWYQSYSDNFTANLQINKTKHVNFNVIVNLFELIIVT